MVTASLIAIPFFTYLAGPSQIEWGIFIALVPMALWSLLAVTVGAAVWAAGLGDVWASALGRGILFSPPLAFSVAIVVEGVVGH
ncbi:hypothetical protein BJ986_001773 [Phycicoccus badiiscoriae]|uniref:Uncharacterized protein n=1 Tax=Pedococcus badiiscoriae TaxID=642776 RepID=A0A852WPK5_9MICO|nr:hypothetical protein [Pedococcus badiiscoriae]NYG07286.1 hypothetical protein [Pedococcus badiiscoriae]